MKQLISIFILASLHAVAQEAKSGFDLRATLSAAVIASGELTEEPRSGSPVDAGFRAVLYPTWKLNEQWTVTGAFQAVSRPWFYESFSTQGHGVKGNLLQGSLNYSRLWTNGSASIRAGVLSTAFGSFPLRYDDADNALIDVPTQYGYYYSPVSNLGLAGVQLDLTQGKWDGRAQLANSSPANPRSIFAKDQYANWAGGVGYTIRQGFRIGLSGYRGPYLDRKYRFFFPGEANPVDLPAHATGIDVQWARGHWYTYGELQRFVMPYRVFPTFRQNAGYAEVKRVLHPRWYLAARVGYLNPSVGDKHQIVETTVGFRPGRDQLFKFGCEIEHYSPGDTFSRTLAMEYVTTIHPLSFARN